MKSQAESVATEYDRLLAEKDKLERKLKIAGVGVGAGDEGTKKDDWFRPLVKISESELKSLFFASALILF